MVLHLVIDRLTKIQNLATAKHFHEGLHKFEYDVFLSLPAVLGENGITNVVKQQLTPEEYERLCKSAAIMTKVQENIAF